MKKILVLVMCFVGLALMGCRGDEEALVERLVFEGVRLSTMDLRM